MKNFVGIGGGEISGWNFKTKDANQDLYQTRGIDEYIVSLTEKKLLNYYLLEQLQKKILYILMQ